jgi:hypothetical protein
MSEKEHKGGRPKKLVKRKLITGVRFTETEYAIIKDKAGQAGFTLSNYLRQMSIHGKVLQRLSDEEWQTVRGVAGMANNFNQLAKLAHKEGAAMAFMIFENYRKEIDGLLGKSNQENK